MTNHVPKTYQRFAESHPELLACYDALNEHARTEGPLSEQEIALIKLGISIGMGMDGAMASHTRKAVKVGVDPKKLEHLAVLALPTLGLPQMMRAWKTITANLPQDS